MEEDKRFFDKQFWRMLVIATFSQLIVLVIAVTVGTVVTGKIDKIIQLTDSLSTTLERVESTINTVTGIDPAMLAEKADALGAGAAVVGEGVGDGGAAVIDRAGAAWNNFKNRKEE